MLLQALAERLELFVLKEHPAKQFTFPAAETDEVNPVGKLRLLRSSIICCSISDVVLNIFSPLQVCLQSRKLRIPPGWGVSMCN